MLITPRKANFLSAGLIDSSCFVLPKPKFAATVNYDSGTHDWVVGNPANAGDATGSVVMKYRF